MKNDRINDDDRRDWINSDEGLYCAQRSSGLSMRRFIRENRAFIDEVINNVRNGRKPAHYLRYGG
jgi:hypothetical protein